MPLDVLKDEMGINVEDNEYDSESVGGFIIEIIGEIPEIGKKIKFKNTVFEILKATKTKIDKIKVKIDTENIKEETNVDN